MLRCFKRAVCDVDSDQILTIFIPTFSGRKLTVQISSDDNAQLIVLTITQLKNELQFS